MEDGTALILLSISFAKHRPCWKGKNRWKGCDENCVWTTQQSHFI